MAPDETLSCERWERIRLANTGKTEAEETRM